MFMLSSDLKSILAELAISQTDLAKLVAVTPRAVAMWIAGDREAPGAVEAYLRLLIGLPPGQRQAELSRIKQRNPTMRDGMYGIEFAAAHGAGIACLVFDSGRIYGVDPLGGRYDGGYVYDETSGLADLKLKVTMPPNVPSVLGIQNPYEWAIDVGATLDPKAESGRFQVSSSIGQPLVATYKFLRSLPDA
jgi:hypothetical protein